MPTAVPATVVIVAGPHGSGKTTWILQQILSASSVYPPPDLSSLYLSLGGAGLPLDALYLSSQIPNLTVLTENTLDQVECWLAQGQSLYLEIDASLDLSQLELPNSWPLHRVAILPQASEKTDWQAWADTVIASPKTVSLKTDSVALWTAELTGQVFDLASLEVLWSELIQGAYGRIERAKGIFCVANGQVLWFSYTASDWLGQAPQNRPSDFPHFTVLPLEPTLSGRPDYPSGIEVVGTQLDKTSLIGTLKDCFLSDELLERCQATLQASQPSSPSTHP